MSVIKQISVYNGTTNNWGTPYDIGANASNISLSTTLAGGNNVLSALRNILPSSQLSGNQVVVTGADKRLTNSSISINQLNILKELTLERIPITSFYNNRCSNATSLLPTVIYRYGKLYIGNISIKMLVKPDSTEETIIALPSNVGKPQDAIWGTIYNRTQGKIYRMFVSTAGNINIVNLGTINTNDLLQGQIIWASQNTIN